MRPAPSATTAPTGHERRGEGPAGEVRAAEVRLDDEVEVVDRLLELPERTRFQVLAPVVRARKGEYVDLFAELQSKGFARARVDGEVVSLTEHPDMIRPLARRRTVFRASPPLDSKLPGLAPSGPR